MTAIITLDPRFSVESEEVRKFFAFINPLIKRVEFPDYPVTGKKDLTVFAIEVNTFKQPNQPKEILKELNVLHCRSLNKEEAVQYGMKKHYEIYTHDNIIISENGKIVVLHRGLSGCCLETFNEISADSVLLACKK